MCSSKTCTLRTAGTCTIWCTLSTYGSSPAHTVERRVHTAPHCSSLCTDILHTQLHNVGTHGYAPCTQLHIVQRCLNIVHTRLHGNGACTQASQCAHMTLHRANTLPYAVYRRQNTLHRRVKPQSNQSTGPVRFLIFCTISISLLASLVAGRRAQCKSGAD
jgi:hypothetical protein